METTIDKQQEFENNIKHVGNSYDIEKVAIQQSVATYPTFDEEINIEFPQSIQTQ